MDLDDFFGDQSGQGGAGKGQTNPAQVQKFLEGVNYPADKSSLVENARNKGADKNVISTLERLPEKEYDSPASVSEELGRMS